MSKFTEITMTVGDAIELYKGLEAVKKHKGARFAIIVGRNMKELFRLLKEYEDMAKPSEEFMHLSAKAHKLAEAEDEEGIKALEAENEILIESRKKQLAELENALKNEVVLNLETIREDQLPEEVTGEEVVPILPIVV